MLSLNSKKYLIGEKIGEGSNGKVFLALNENNEQVCIKISKEKNISDIYSHVSKSVFVKKDKFELIKYLANKFNLTFDELFVLGNQNYNASLEPQEYKSQINKYFAIKDLFFDTEFSSDDLNFYRQIFGSELTTFNKIKKEAEKFKFIDSLCPENLRENMVKYYDSGIPQIMDNFSEKIYVIVMEYAQGETLSKLKGNFDYRVQIRELVTFFSNNNLFDNDIWNEENIIYNEKKKKFIKIDFGCLRSL